MNNESTNIIHLDNNFTDMHVFACNFFNRPTNTLEHTLFLLKCMIDEKVLMNLVSLS